MNKIPMKLNFKKKPKMAGMNKKPSGISPSLNKIGEMIASKSGGMK
jgi:hypothetical protein